MALQNKEYVGGGDLTGALHVSGQVAGTLS